METPAPISDYSTDASRSRPIVQAATEDLLNTTEDQVSTLPSATTFLNDAYIRGMEDEQLARTRAEIVEYGEQLNDCVRIGD